MALEDGKPSHNKFNSLQLLMLQLLMLMLFNAFSAGIFLHLSFLSYTQSISVDNRPEVCQDWLEQALPEHGSCLDPGVQADTRPHGGWPEEGSLLQRDLHLHRHGAAASRHSTRRWQSHEKMTGAKNIISPNTLSCSLFTIIHCRSCHPHLHSAQLWPGH